MNNIRRFISLLVAFSLLLSLVPVSALAYYAEKQDGVAFIDNKGNLITTNPGWEETFPYGTFAFSTSEVTVTEGGASQVITVYRLGGTTGRAEAYITYMPVIPQIEDDRHSYANAAGALDIRIEVEDPLPIAQYQPIGSAPEPLAPEPGVGILAEAEKDGEGEPTGDIILTAAVAAEAYQWFVSAGSEWNAVSGASGQSMLISAEYLEEYDFRCVFTLDGQAYGTDSAKGQAYAVPEGEILPEMPEEGVDLNPAITYTVLPMDEGEYDGYVFRMVFAEGEWIKQIIVTAFDDDLHEADEFGVFTIVDSKGASLYDTANTLTLHVKDNEEILPSYVSFAVGELLVDKAGGKAKLPVRRTGAIQYVVSVDYSTADGTAKAGTDYASTSGTLVFYGDVDELFIEIPLINNGVTTDTLKEFTVELSGLKGAGNTGNSEIINGKMTVYLYNINVTASRNVASLLWDGDAVDASGLVTGTNPGYVLPPAVIQGDEVVDTFKGILAEIIPAGEPSGEVGSLTYDYTSYEDRIRFSSLRLNPSVYHANYWKDWAYLANTNNNTLSLGYDVNDVSGYMANYKSLWTHGDTANLSQYGSGSYYGVQYTNKDTGRVYAFIPYMSKRFDAFRGYMAWRVSLASGLYGFQFTYPGFSIEYYSDSSPSFYSVQPGMKDVSVWYEYRIAYDENSWPSATWSMSSHVDQLSLWTQQTKTRSATETAMSAMLDGILKRRFFSNNFLNLRIYTANDQDSPDPVPIQTDGSGIYGFLKPEVKVLERHGGVTTNGQLYVGSILQIQLKSTATYFPAVKDTNLYGSVYLTNSAGTIVAWGAGKDSIYTYNLGMLWPSLTEEGLKDTYTLNVVMTRKQDIEVNIAPSVPRLPEADGSPGMEIDPDKTGQAIEDFWNSTTGITYGYHSASDAEPDKFQYNTGLQAGSLTEEHFLTDIEAKAVVRTSRKVDNLQWINFNLPAEDIILFNGRAYAGNEPIMLSVGDLASQKLTFRYYDSEYISALSVMSTSIDTVALFLDRNGNGQIDGFFNENIGYFVLTEVDGVEDEFIGFLEDMDYEETLFAPIYSESLGRYIQYFLKVIYSMTPRSLVVPEGGSMDDFAQILPAFVTNVTHPETYAALSREMQGYRYIISGKGKTFPFNADITDISEIKEIMEGVEYTHTSDNHTMYTMAASRKSMLDIPLGGDHSPAALSGEIYTWEPDYQGNLLYSFADPEPIHIPHSLAGDNIPIAGIIGVGEDGKAILEDGGAEKLNEYLGSLTANDNFAMAVRVQTHTVEDILELQNGMITNPTESGGQAFDNSGIGGVGTYPSSAYLKVMEAGQDAPDSEFGMDESGNEYGEFNVDFGFKLPDMKIAASKYVTIIMNGYEVGFSIGLPLGKIGKDAESDKGIGSSNKDNMDMLKSFFNGSWSDFLKDDSFDPGNESKLKSSNFSISFSVALAFMFKYNTLDNTYYFSEFTVSVSAKMEYRYQYRFTPVPIVYVYVAIGLDVKISTGLTVVREVVEDEVRYLNPLAGQPGFMMGKGNSFSFSTDVKAFNIYFSGKLLLESADSAGNPLADVKTGFISSGGEKPITVVLVQQKGYDLDQPITVKLSAMDDSTYITKIVEVTSAESNTYWNGIKLEPEIWLEAGAGVGVEMLKFEIFVKVSIGATMVYGAYAGKDVDNNPIYDPFKVKKFDFKLGLGFRVVLLLFNFEMDLIQYFIKYEEEKWTHGWTALGGMFGESHDLSEGGSMVNVSLPKSTYATQRIYGPGDGNSISTMAYDPTDPAVPFQLSGYASSGDASKLVDGLVTGYDYRIVTVGDDNYLVFTISRGAAANAVDNSMLVLSRLKLTSSVAGDSYGLVNPVDETDPTPYIILDDDGTGDLEFYTWSDSSVIHAVWVSYATVSDAAPVLPLEPTSPKPLAFDDPATPEDETGVEMDIINYENEILFPQPSDPGLAPVEPSEPDEAQYYTVDATDPAKPVYVPTLPYTTYDEAKDAYDAAMLIYDGLYAQYLLNKAAHDAAVIYYNSFWDWYPYFGQLADYRDYIQSQAGVAARNTVAKTASFTVEDLDMDGINDAVAFTPAATLTPAPGSNVFLPEGGHDGSVLFYAGTQHYTAPELQQADDTYREYLDAVYGPDSSFSEYRARYQRASYDIYGKNSSLNLAVNTAGTWDTTSLMLAEGRLLENMEMTPAGGGSYYLAYSTGESYYIDGNGTTISSGFDAASDLVRISRFYLRKVTVAPDGTVDWGTSYLLRTLINYDMDNTMDGVYSGSSMVTPYKDPYITNLQFLTGELDMHTGVQTFLLVEMNGNTHIVSQEHLAAITDGGAGSLTPFFTSDDFNSPTGKGEVTIGADGDGNIAAVYTDTVDGTTNNALYVTKYDPATGTWGEGRMLAMNLMQVYEDGMENGWTAEETEKAYFGMLPGYAGGGMSQFIFSGMQIALGQKSTVAPTEIIPMDASADMTLMDVAVVMETAVPMQDPGSSTLLVLTGGTLTNLKMTEYTLLDQAFESITADGDGSVGFYALSFGVGNQAIGEVSLSFATYDFTVNSELVSSISFVNTGDVAIRGSAAQPVDIELWVSPDGLSLGVMLDAWTVSQNIAVGQKVRLNGTADPLTETLPFGSVFYLVVHEDLGYTTDGFSYSTLVDGGNLTVLERAELGYEKSTIRSAGADASGNTILQVEFQVGNRGTKTAEGVFVQFSYQNGKDENGRATYLPLDLREHNLTISAQQELETLDASTAIELQNGILRLYGIDNSDDIFVNNGRTVEGTVIVPHSAYFTEGITGSLNLKLQIYSAADTVTGYDNGIYIAEHDEYNPFNNIRTMQIEHSTYFGTADNIAIALGTTMRLPVNIRSTTGQDPVVTVTEMLNDNTGTEEKHLGILYYSQTGGYIVVTPSTEGNGYIRIADTATNAFKDIAYTVTSEGDGINVFINNSMFSFINADDKPYDLNGTEQSWSFLTNVPTWGLEGTEAAPYLYDISSCSKGASFTFNTVASSIELFFNGTVKVESTFPGSVARTATGTGGTFSETFEFADNPDYYTHMVTVTAISDSASFDKFIEGYTGVTPTPADDDTSPQVYWSRSFPDTASIESGSESVTLTCYVIDETGLAIVNLNGAEPSNIVKSSDGFWHFDITRTDNGTMTVRAIDTSGNMTVRTIMVDWFNNVVSTGSNAYAPELEAWFEDQDGQIIPGTGDYLDPDTHMFLDYTAGSLDSVVVEEMVTLYDASEVDFVTFLPDGTGTYPVTENGYYRVIATDENDKWRSVILHMGRIDRAVPTVELWEADDNPATSSLAGRLLSYSAYKEQGLSPITTLTLNGKGIAFPANRMSVSGTVNVLYDGHYLLYAEDSGGNSGEAGILVENIPVHLLAPGTFLIMPSWNVAKDTGSIILDESMVTGGKYNEDLLLSEGTYEGSYEYALVPFAQSFTGARGSAAEQAFFYSLSWQDDPGFINLAPGEYRVYARDTRQLENTTVIGASQSILVPDDSVSYTTMIKSTSIPSSTDGSIIATATGGKSGTGQFEFALIKLASGTQELTPLNEIDNWTAETDDMGFARDWCHFVDLSFGWYQLAARDSQLDYSDSANYANAATGKVYVPFPSYFYIDPTHIQPEDLDYSQPGTVRIFLTSTKWRLSLATETRLQSDNATRGIFIRGNGVFLWIPAGTLAKGGSVGKMIIQIPGKGNVVLRTDEHGNTRGVPWSLVSEDLLLYIASEPGTYSLHTLSHSFGDVPGHWGSDAIGFAYSHSLFKGTGENTFAPDALMDRAMFVTVLGRLHGIDPSDYTGTIFKDVPAGTWYAPYVQWAAEAGITQGYGTGVFGPQDHITREQLCVMMARYLDHAGILLEKTEPLRIFADQGSISPWAREAVSLMQQTGLMVGMGDNRFHPQGMATRAQVATIFHRLVEKALAWLME